MNRPTTVKEYPFQDPIKPMVSFLLSLTCLAFSGGLVQAYDDFRGKALSSYEVTLSSIVSYDLYVNVSQEILLHRKPSAKIKGKAASNNQIPGVAKGLDRPMYFHSRQRLSQDRYRADLLRTREGEVPEGQATFIWDGVTATTYSSMSRKGRITTRPPDEGMQPQVLSYGSLYRNINCDQTYLQLINSRPRDEMKLVRDGSLFTLISMPHVEKQNTLNSDLGLTLVLDSSKSFMPSSIEWFFIRNGKKVTWQTYENNLAEIQPGLWLPVKSIHSVYNMSSTSDDFGKEAGRQTATLDLARSRWNIVQPENIFQISFPSGTEVNDEVKNIDYRIGDVSKSAYLDRLATEGRLGVEQLQNKEARYRNITKIAEPLWRRFLVPCFAGAAIFGVVYLSLRMLRRRLT